MNNKREDLEPRKQSVRNMEEKASVLTYCTYNILFVNDMVMTCAHDIIHYIKPSPLYAHTSKRYLENLIKHKSAYETMLQSIYHNKFEGSLADMIDMYMEHFDNDIALLRQSIRQHLESKGDKYAELKSYVYLGKVMSELAVAIFNDRQKIIKSIPNRPYGGTLSFLTIKDIATDCDGLASNMGYYGKDSACSEAQTLLDRISHNLADAQLINDSLL